MATVVGVVGDIRSSSLVSYAGMVWHDGLLWVSYYASHEGRSAIYLARVTPAN